MGSSKVEHSVLARPATMVILLERSASKFVVIT